MEKIEIGTEVVSGGIRGKITAIEANDAWVTWETNERSVIYVSRIRPKNSPATVRGVSTIRVAKGANRL